MTLTQTEQNPIGQLPSERLPYEKPAMRSISLVADEVLATGCKTTLNPVAPLNPVGCLSSACSSAGS